MGGLRYDGVEYEVADNVIATLREVYRIALVDGATFRVSLFEPTESVNAELTLGPGIPLATTLFSGEIDHDAVRRWVPLALEGEAIRITCLDLACDCVLRPPAPAQ